jgi:hypothetical protein
LGRDELDGKTESHQAILEGQIPRAMETGSLADEIIKSVDNGGPSRCVLSGIGPHEILFRFLH